MASRRMIDAAFWQSETVAQLTIEQRLLFIGLFSNADDQGRMRAHPRLIRSMIFPYDDIAGDDILDGLQAISSVGGILMYKADGKSLIQIINWWKYQHLKWAWPSSLPAPRGWTDRVRHRQGNTVISDNWDTPPKPKDAESETEVEPTRDGDDTDANSAPRDRDRDSGSTSGSQEEIEQQEEPASLSDFIAESMQAFQNDIGLISSGHQKDDILSYLDELTDRGACSWWQGAIDAAVDQNVRKWAYVRGILDNCLREGRPPMRRTSPPGKLQKRRVTVINPDTGEEMQVEATV